MQEVGEVERLARREVVLLGSMVVSVAGVTRVCTSIYMLKSLVEDSKGDHSSPFHGYAGQIWGSCCV